jgi:hypothetical protein
MEDNINHHHHRIIVVVVKPQRNHKVFSYQQQGSPADSFAKHGMGFSPTFPSRAPTEDRMGLWIQHTRTRTTTKWVRKNSAYPLLVPEAAAAAAAAIIALLVAMLNSTRNHSCFNLNALQPTTFFAGREWQRARTNELLGGLRGSKSG